MIAFDKRLGEFEKRNVQVLGCSVDSRFSHLRWKEMPVNEGGIGKVGYPLVEDIDKKIARQYDVLLGAQNATVYTDEEEVETTVNGGVTLRGSFLIDEDGKVRHEIKNDLPLGRNIDEMLRLIDALDHHNKHGEVCPAGWTQGKTGMKPSDDGMRDFLASSTEEL